MADRNPARALDIVQRVENLCDFVEHPAIREALKAVPTSMPRDLGSFRFEAPLWVGFGIVGLWAALDAFADRAGLPCRKCPTCLQCCLPQRFDGHTRGTEIDALQELDDLRHLYAHNYAGEVDIEYEKRRRRHVLIRGQATDLTVGARFDGQWIPLNLDHLRQYAGVARAVLQRFL